MVVKEKEKSLIQRLEEEPFGGCTLRVRKARQRCFSTMPSVCLEGAKILTEVFMKTEGEPTAVRKAKAFRETCQRGTIFIQDDELIIGCPGSRIRAGMPSPDDNYLVLDPDTISTRPGDPFAITEDQKRLWKEFIAPYWKGKSFLDAWKPRVPKDLNQFQEAVIFHCRHRTEGAIGIFIPNYELVIQIGINGIRKKINDRLAALDAAVPGDYEKIVYLNAQLIVCDGIETRSKRYARLAREKAGEEKVPQRKAELEKIAEICQQVPVNPARTFWEALQSLWFYHACLWMEHNGVSYNPGRLDQYLYPYYKKDIEEGRLTKERAQELLECLMVKLNEVNFLSDRVDLGSVKYGTGYGYAAWQQTCCGGVTEDGQDGVNDLSYMWLQAMMDVRLPQPHMSLRYNKAKNPDSFLRKAAELVALGMGHPTFYNDVAGIRSLVDRGIPVEEAYNWSTRGCYEPGLMGKLHTGDMVELNMAAAVELALLNGVHRKTKTRLPVPQTGDPRNFKTYGEFKDAVKTQLVYIIKRAVELDHMLEVIQQEQRQVLLTSLAFEECIEKGKDIMSGGAKYNSGPDLPLGGTADVSNSLVAVKKLIYEDKKLTWDELLQALDSNFEGYEQIREMCLSAPKYGNDIPEVDEIATEITGFAAEEVRKYKGLHGGSMTPHSYGARNHFVAGEHLGALPSGRKAWVPVADTMAPMQGTDTKGPTAVLKSLSKCRLDLFTDGGSINLKLDPSLFEDERGIGYFINLIKSFQDLGLFQVAFNVVSPETLREAQRHPEDYEGLIVRVAGYSAYFVHLDKKVQDDIISRTTHAGLV
ncbi:glycyl radical protein [Chloroflexota bacterium]